MIRGLVHTDGETSDCFMCGFCEGTTVTNIKAQDDGSELIKHVFSDEFCSGLLSGGTQCKSILVVHPSCQGKCCSCEHFAVQYLEQDTLENLETYCLTTARQALTQYPLLAVIIYERQKACITYYSEDDYVVVMLTSASYEIRDCLLCDVDSQKFPNFIEHPDIIQNIDIYDEAQRVVDSLAASYELWPKVSGLGMSFCNFTQKTAFLINNPTDFEDLGSIVDCTRPKGPITAFNFFSKYARKCVLDNLDDKSLSNNDLNKILGHKWKDMSHTERNPYHIQAAQDRKRYLQEVSVFNARKRDKWASSHSGLGKPLTAYNHFVHQEKLFIMGLNLSDAQTRMGKHGGDRWNDMDKAEKSLYLILREADALEYS